MPQDHVYPRPVLEQLPRYAAGKPAPVIEGLTPYKLSSNENPYGPVPAVHKVLSEFSDYCRYPDPMATALRERLSLHLEVPAEDIVTGAGSLGALTQIINTFAGSNSDGSQDEVIYAWRSFEAYPIVVRTAGAKDIQVPLTADHRHDLDAMAAAINERTRVIILCTPNNPTGPILKTAEVEAFMAKVPTNVLVVLDEAYLEFVRDPEAVDGIAMYRKYPNLVALRTFSKAHGLANLRVGYSLSNPELTQHLRVIQTPFAVSTVASEAAIASLDSIEEVMDRVNDVVEERVRVQAALTEIGWDLPESHANFVWLPMGKNTQAFAAKGAEVALALRAFGDEGLRVSIGEVEANDRFIQLCRDNKDMLP